MTYKTKGVNKMSNTQTLCDCGCDVRGLTRFQLSGYRKNYDKKTINGSDVVDKHLNNNEHVIAFDLGYVDLDLAVRTANELIWETEKKAETIVEWYEIWDCTNDHKVKTICQHTKMQYGNDDGTDWYYCDNCDYLQVS
tara:strand:+ start:179 stop:592 length:414 start_codon:yes stop_codon:yes gene_type:complete